MQEQKTQAKNIHEIDKLQKSAGMTTKINKEKLIMIKKILHNHQQVNWTWHLNQTWIQQRMKNAASANASFFLQQGISHTLL